MLLLAVSGAVAAEAEDSRGFTLCEQFQGSSNTLGVVTRLDTTSTTKANKHRTQTGKITTGASPSANFSDRLARNSALSSRLQSLLPAGTNLRTASAGFKSQGQFIAAVHLSHNLNIPFDQLTAKLTGSTHESLGKAIHDLRPNLSARQARADVRTAQRQAERDLASNRLADQLARNSALRARLRSLVPAGTNLQTAAAGYKNEGTVYRRRSRLAQSEYPLRSVESEARGTKSRVAGTTHSRFENKSKCENHQDGCQNRPAAGQA